MQFTISKDKLNSCLNMVSMAIPPKTTNFILKNVFVEAKKEKVTFRGTNNILDISVTVQADVKEEGACCFDNMLSGVIQNFNNEDIKISLVNSKLTVSQGRRRHNPLHTSITNYPPKQKIKKYIEYDPAELLVALSRTAICASTLIDVPTTQGFFINPESKFIITSDGERVSIWENIDLPGKITIPHSKVVMPILSYVSALGESGKFELSLGQWTGFKGTVTHNDMGIISWEIIFNSLAGDYPDVSFKTIKNYTKIEPELKLIAEKLVIKNTLEICRTYSDRAYNEGRPHQVILSNNGQGIMLSMQIPDLIEMEEHLECEIDGGDFEYWLDPRFLLEAVNQVQSDKVELRFFDHTSPFILKDSEVDNFTYLQVAMVSTKKE